MIKKESSDFLQKVYSAQDDDELKKAYDHWAPKYDEHVTAFGYIIPAVVAGLFGKYVTLETSPILDAGAGTGLMEGKWKLSEKTKMFPGLPLENPELFHRVYVYRVI